MLDDYLAILDTLTQRIQAVNRQIEAYAKTDARVELLMSMSGIGLYSAILILAEVGDIHRFENARQWCSFAGLVPSIRTTDPLASLVDV
jgi:transposase